MRRTSSSGEVQDREGSVRLSKAELISMYKHMYGKCTICKVVMTSMNS
jgi:hypothetical protein